MGRREKKDKEGSKRKEIKELGGSACVCVYGGNYKKEKGIKI